MPYITRVVLDELREVYPEILRQEVVSLPDALSLVKDKTGRKFIIIIDEWDVLIRDESANKKVQDEYIRFLRGMFKGNIFNLLILQASCRSRKKKHNQHLTIFENIPC